MSCLVALRTQHDLTLSLSLALRAIVLSSSIASASLLLTTVKPEGGSASLVLDLILCEGAFRFLLVVVRQHSSRV
jgi:hypothetical protein